MKSLKKLRADAQKARQKLAELESQFAEWRAFCARQQTVISAEDYGRVLDDWIIRLGDARHAEAAATKIVIANTPKSDQ